MPNVLFTKYVCDKAITKISEGDKSALSVIYDHMGRQIYSVAYSIVKNSHDAEDVFQDTFIKIMQNAGQYHRGSNAKAWILAITRNLAISCLRSYHNKLSLEDDTFEFQDSSLTVNADTLHIQLLEALSTLSYKEQQIVQLKLETGLTHKEIASVMTLSDSCVEKKYERAIKKLQAYFKN